jgi:hypothetical protein
MRRPRPDVDVANIERLEVAVESRLKTWRYCPSARRGGGTVTRRRTSSMNRCCALIAGVIHRWTEVPRADRRTRKRLYQFTAIDDCTRASVCSRPKECCELLHTSPQLQDFLLDSDPFRFVTSTLTTTFGCLAEPATAGRAGNPEIRGDGHVPGAVDEIPKPLIVALLRRPEVVMRMIIGGSFTPLNLSRAVCASTRAPTPSWRSH